MMVYTRGVHTIPWLPQFRWTNTVRAAREKTYETMCCFRGYSESFPQHFPSIRVRSVRGDVAVVEEHLNLGGRRLVIMAKHVSRPPVAHDMFVIGGDLKGTNVRQVFSTVGEDTLVVTDVNLKLGLALGIKSAFGHRDQYKRDYGAILDDLATAAAESA